MYASQIIVVFIEKKLILQLRISSSMILKRIL